MGLLGKLWSPRLAHKDPRIPIKVIATTPVAITLKLIFFSFLFLSNLKDITNF